MLETKMIPRSGKVPDFVLLIGSVLLLGMLYFLAIIGELSSNTMRYLTRIFLYIVLGQMWNLLSGFAGMISLGQQLFVGLASYAVAVATTLFHLPIALGIALAVAVCLVTAPLISLLLLRLDGMYFSIATWVVAEAVATFFFSWKYVGQGSGMVVTSQPYPSTAEIYILALTISAVALVTTFFLLRSKAGIGLAAMRDDSTAAASVGVNTRRHRILVYVTAAFFIGIASAVFVVNKGIVHPDSGFSISWTIAMIFIVTIGGSGTISGPIVGAIIYVLLQERLAHYPGWSNIILGVITVLTILLLPNGIVGTLQRKLGFEILSVRRFSKPLQKK